jgi:cysteinyl-tRNA synthetase
MPAMREIPDEIRRAADERAAARAVRDWHTADRLRAEIEAAGWKVVDAGARYRLQRAYAPDRTEGAAVRYGRSESVASRLEEPDAAPASVVIVASVDAFDAARAGASVIAHSPATPIVVVSDAPSDEEVLDDLDGGIEIVRTTGALGHGAALAIGLRRATGRVVVLMDPSVEATGDVVTPLVEALDRDPEVAVVGAFGLVSTDLRHYDEVEDGEAAAIEGYLMAFRRADVAARGPIDERFRFYRNLDVWWSLVLRDEGEGARPRRAVVVPGLPLIRHEHRAWSSVEPAERDRLSKRNFYRILDRFGHRSDLAVSGGKA